MLHNIVFVSNFAIVLSKKSEKLNSWDGIMLQV